MNRAELKQKLCTFFKGEVASDEATLAAYSRDAGFFSVKPRLVVFPRNVDAVNWAQPAIYLPNLIFLLVLYLWFYWTQRKKHF